LNIIARELKALMLAGSGQKLAVAESLTCGRVQSRVGEISGASAYFLGGITAYTLAEKVRHLGVDATAAGRVNSVSAEVAEQMARGVCQLFDADLGVATTGYAEPDSAWKVREPFAWWALAHRQRATRAGARSARWVQIRSGRIECPGATRLDTQLIVADAVLTELVGYLRESAG
jgi:nicotinamide-nucleotide amidase